MEPIDRRFTRATCPIHEREKRVVSLAPPTTTRRDPGCARPRRRPASPSRRFSGHGNGDGASPRGPSGGAPAPGARLRHHRRDSALLRGGGAGAAQKCRIAASRGVSVIRAYGDRRRNDDAPRGGGGWTNEFGDEYDAIDDDDGYFEERRAPAGRPDRGRAPDRGRRFDDDRRRGGFGRAEVGDLRRRGEGGRDGGRRNDRRRDDDGDWVEVRPNDGSAREETRCARPHGGRFHL